MTRDDSQGLSVRTKRVAILVAVVSLALAGVLMSRSFRRPPPARPIDRVLRSQRDLPLQSLRALQDLRVFGSVQLTYFMEKRRFGSVEELQRGGYLSPRWPAVLPDAYKISCEVAADSQSFVCFADAVDHGQVSFRVDPSQAIRFRRGQRPDNNSQIFGISEEIR